MTRIVMNSRFRLETYSVHGDRFDIGADKEVARVTGHAGNDPISPKRLAVMRESDGRYFIKTHFLPDYRTSTDDRVVYVVRDGRDVMCSYYHYLRQFSPRHTSLQDVILGQVPFGLWAAHVEAWTEAVGNQGKVVRYEAFLEDPERFISDLSAFLGVADNGGELASFSELSGMNQQFFRKGRAGGWSDEMSSDDEMLFWAVHGDVMIQQGYTRERPSHSGEEIPVPSAEQQLRRALETLHRTSRSGAVREPVGSQGFRSTEARRMRKRLDQLHNSFSWRLTEPLRRAYPWLAWIRRLR